MTNTIQSPYTSEQIAAWLRGLLTIAWADGDFDEQEQNVITTLTQDELAPKIDLGDLSPISPQELALILGDNTSLAQNFLRTAVMVALADGIYSFSEDKILHQFFLALKQNPETLDALRHTVYEHKTKAGVPTKIGCDVLHPVRDWLDKLEVEDPRVARFLCKLIPPQCPFERDIKLFGHKIVHIPPLCKINPLYEQLVGLRFRALSYLADDCKEDVSAYC